MQLERERSLLKDFLRSSSVGRAVLRGGGEGDGGGWDGASTSSGAVMAFCVAFAIIVWRIVGRGERARLKGYRFVI